MYYWDLVNIIKGKLGSITSWVDCYNSGLVGYDNITLLEVHCPNSSTPLKISQPDYKHEHSDNQIDFTNIHFSQTYLEEKTKATVLAKAERSQFSCSMRDY